MYIRFEVIQKPNSYCDSTITSLRWMKHDSQADTPLGRQNNADVEIIFERNYHHQHQHMSDVDLNNNGVGVGGGGGGGGPTWQRQQPSDQPRRSAADNGNDEMTNSEEVDADREDGWLALGTARSIVGVCFTSSRYNVCRALCPEVTTDDNGKETSTSTSTSLMRFDHMGVPLNTLRQHLPRRTNYNLRGHRGEITFVSWNEPYQKLTTCDERGVIFIWIKYEGRWSVELINDRNIRVTDIKWSHDGRMALICYQDGFVLVGSVNGQRYWSTSLNISDCTITCGTWTPSDQHVLFGTSNGHILVVSSTGTFVTQVSIQEGVEICALHWSCRRFFSSYTSRLDRNYLLAVCFVDGTIHLMKGYDDFFPVAINTGLLNIKTDWSHNGQVLMVGGHKLKKVPSGDNNRLGATYSYKNVLHFYTCNGTLIKSVTLDCDQQPLSALTWGNADQRVYVACGTLLFVGWVFFQIPSLNFLARLKVVSCLGKQFKFASIPVPEPIKYSLNELVASTICCYLPNFKQLREFTFRPPPTGIRLHCTLLRHDEPSGICGNGNTGASSATTDNGTYVLYLEYLGGLVPILKGKRSSKLKTEFVIFDPEVNKDSMNIKFVPWQQSVLKGSLVPSPPESETDEANMFPYLTPKTRRRLRCRSAQLRRYFAIYHHREQQRLQEEARRASMAARSVSPLQDPMGERSKIVLVASNMWGTKFKFVGLNTMLPSILGSMTYRTSFLHLQPRQMTVTIKEMNTTNTRTTNNSSLGCSLYSHYGSTNCLVSSDSEDEYSLLEQSTSGHHRTENSCSLPVIAPTTPLPTVRNSMLFSTVPPLVDNEQRQRQQQQPESVSQQNTPPAPVVQNFGETTEQQQSRQLQRESNSVTSCLTNLSDEFLTLQINQNESGSSTYSLEMSPYLGSQRRVMTMTKELETYQENDDMPPVVTTTSGAVENSNNVSSSNSNSTTMLQQFKHQAFQSESPKHVSYFRQPHISSVSKLNTPNVSPSKCIRQKILKESPRKSSVFYCCSELSTPIKTNYIDSAVCDIEPNNPRSPFRTLKYKSCANEAYATSSKLNNSFGGSCHLLLETDTTNTTTCTQTILARSTAAAAADSSHHDHSVQIKDPTQVNQESAMVNGNVQTNSINDTNQNSPVRDVIKEIILDSADTATAPQPPSLADEEFNYLSNVEQLVKTLSNRLSAQTPSSSINIETRKNYEQVKTVPAPVQVPVVSNSSSTSRGNKHLQKTLLNHIIRRNSLPFELKTVSSEDSSFVSKVNNKSRQTTTTIAASDSQQQRPSTADCTIGSNNNSNASIVSDLSLANSMSLPQRSHLSLPSSPIVSRRRESITDGDENHIINVNKQRSNGRHFFYSPNVIRKMRRKLSYLDCSSEEDNSSDDDDNDNDDGIDSDRSLASWSQNRLNNSSRSTTTTGGDGGDGGDGSCCNSNNKERIIPKACFGGKAKSKVKNKKNVAHSNNSCCSRNTKQSEGKEFVLHNKAPLWNEVTQVYQLDFGGRVTQESAKNFQIEHYGRQVMQFGRIDKNAYTLDFEYPFSAVQALSVALANVTQRFK